MNRPPSSIRRAAWVILFCLCLAHGPSARQTGGPLSSTGVVVEAVEPNSPAAAGIRAGDVLIGWRLSNEPRGGTLSDPWALEQFAIEVAPRAPVVLNVQRGGTTSDIAMPVRTSRLGLTARPALAPADEVTWKRWVDGALESTELDSSDSSLRSLLDRLSAQARERDAAWLRVRVAERLVRDRAFDRAGREYQALLALPLVAADTRLSAVVHGRIAELSQRQSRWDDALAAIDAAIASDGADAQTLIRASWLHKRAGVLRARGAFDGAQEAAEQARAIRSALAPGSWDEADSIAELGSIALSRRALDEAWKRYEAALAIVARPPRFVLEEARHEFNLALIEWRRGRVADAEQRLAAVVNTTRTLAPESLEHARYLNLAGILRDLSGDLAGAGGHFAESRTIYSRLDPAAPRKQAP